MGFRHGSEARVSSVPFWSTNSVEKLAREMNLNLPLAGSLRLFVSSVRGKLHLDKTVTRS